MASTPASCLLCQVVLALAQLYLLQGHLDLCEQHCTILLQTDKGHEAASEVRGAGAWGSPR